jgi:hypothetical protein
MTLLDRLKPEYKKKLNDQCIKILSTHEYYIDLKVLDAHALCYVLVDKMLNIGTLSGLFYEIKEMKL